MKYDPTIERKTCAVCGVKCQQEGDKYCINCGAKIESGPASESGEPHEMHGQGLRGSIRPSAK